MDKTLPVVCVIEVPFKSSSELLITQPFTINLIVMSGRARTRQMREEYLMIRIMKVLVCVCDGIVLSKFSRIYSHQLEFASQSDMSDRHSVPYSTVQRGSGMSR